MLTAKCVAEYLSCIKEIMKLDEELYGLRYIYIKSITLKREIENQCYVTSTKIELDSRIFPQYWELCVVVRQAERKLKYGGNKDVISSGV